MAEVRNIMILTGAGISAESGLATFRAEDGLWEGHRVEEKNSGSAIGDQPTLLHGLRSEPTVWRNVCFRGAMRTSGTTDFGAEAAIVPMGTKCQILTTRTRAEGAQRSS